MIPGIIIKSLFPNRHGYDSSISLHYVPSKLTVCSAWHRMGSLCWVQFSLSFKSFNSLLMRVKLYFILKANYNEF